MSILEAVLAVVGLATLIAGAVGWHAQRAPELPPEQDLAVPYREGLYAAIRMQTVAQDLEQQMYAEAIRRADTESGGEP